MKSRVWTAAVFVAATLSAAAGAQSRGAMTTRYTGCLESGTMAGAFALTHVVSGDGMKNGAKKNGMKADAMGKPAMKDDMAAADRMAHEAMTPTTLALTAASIDLAGHVGHKVTVTGSRSDGQMQGAGSEMAPFKVTSLKMLAKSCS
jgi:hypothetical protein